MNLPSQCQTLSTGNYLVCNTGSELIVHNILNTQVPAVSCKWNGKKLTLAQYDDISLNVIFIVDENDMIYYLVPSNQLDIYKLYQAKGSIEKIGINKESEIFIRY